ncbi:MAG: lipoprotein-releasing ABC transporter permease subunit [Syntrophales bacterium]|nr:lipoprotein-releasing ABC transporter permease subunit [Syntrophales bacterium]
MSYELFISLRYLRAKRKQVFLSIITFISIGGIFVGVAALIIVLAVMNGFEKDLRDKILGVNSHIILMEHLGPMKDHRRVAAEVQNVPGVVASTPFIYTQAMLRHGRSVSGAIVRGLDTASAFKVISLGKMVSGRIEHLAGRTDGHSRPSAANAAPGIVLGKELAKHIGAFLNDEITVITPFGEMTPVGMVPKMKRFAVVGIFESGFYEYDSTLAYISLRDAQQFLAIGDGVTGIEIKVDDIYQADVIAKAIEKKLGFPYWARHWMEMNKNLFSALRLEKRVMFIILSLIVLVAAFNIITTLIMVVMEKNKDIAILKSMGATAKSIMRIFIYQGLIIGVVGTVTGCAAGLAVALNLADISRFVERLFGIKILPGDVYYLTELPSRVNPADVVTIVIGTLLLCFASTLYPSWRAARLDPAEVLRYE